MAWVGQFGCVSPMPFATNNPQKQSQSALRGARSMSRAFTTIVASFIFSLAPVSMTQSAGASISRPQGEERIDINAASVEELRRLPGIGPVLASRIVEHRRRHGLFKRPQDVIIVRGMSAKLYRRIAHLIRV
jgi:competence protein ComEA